MKVKICGMKYSDNILACAALNPDYMGFIFYNKSPRYFSGEIPPLPSKIKKTAVFFNETQENVLSKCKNYGFSAVQLHGSESPKYCKKIKAHGLEVIKSFAVDESFDFSVLTPYSNACDSFLFDTKGDKVGGNGYTFNWDILEKYVCDTPLFLSGGIDQEHADTINLISQKMPNIYAIDINSKFELSPALKNVHKIKKFVNYIT